MSGYNGYSMSNNAVQAYEDGEKPYSKWTKKAILEAIDKETNRSSNEFKNVPVAVLREMFLYCSSWHHTSKYYNQTDFYSLDTEKVENITKQELQEYVSTVEHIGAKREEKLSYRANCEYLLWSGSRNHPKATKYTEDGTITGNWFVSDTGVRKSINSNGFKILKRW